VRQPTSSTHLPAAHFWHSIPSPATYRALLRTPTHYAAHTRLPGPPFPHTGAGAHAGGALVVVNTRTVAADGVTLLATTPAPTTNFSSTVSSHRGPLPATLPPTAPAATCNLYPCHA